MGKLGLLNEIVRIGVGSWMKQRLDAQCMVSFRKKAAAQIPLRVGVDRQQPFPPFLAGSGEQPHGVRLAHATFQVDDGDRPCVMSNRHGRSVAVSGRRSRGEVVPSQLLVSASLGIRAKAYFVSAGNDPYSPGRKRGGIQRRSTATNSVLALSKKPIVGSAKLPTTTARSRNRLNSSHAVSGSNAQL